MKRVLILVALAFASVACDGGGRFEGELAGDCSDEADNDRDGRFDCADEGCSGAPQCGGSVADAGPQIFLVDSGPQAPVDSSGGSVDSTCPSVAGLYRARGLTLTCSDALRQVDIAVQQSGCSEIVYDLTFHYADGTSDSSAQDVVAELTQLGPNTLRTFQMAGEGSVEFVFDRDQPGFPFAVDIALNTGSRVCEFTSSGS